MNNSQFRSLLSSTPSSSSNGASTPAAAAAAASSTSSSSSSSSMRAPTLGSRARSSIPMTPRTVPGSHRGVDFRRQLADLDGQPPTKKFKSSGPKGVKLAAGYVDRARQNREGGDVVPDDREQRLQALEEMYKLQQIDGATLEQLRRELGVGGKAETTHLVKGLDFELLRRVRAGEDVLRASEGTEAAGVDAQGQVDLDDELDGVLEHEVQAPTRHGSTKVVDEGAEPEAEAKAAATAEVLSRDEILRRLKASRSAAMMPPPPPEAVLNDRFKKVGSDSKAEKTRFTEIVNGRRREVLMTTDKDGKRKRKVRWLDPPGTHVEPAVEAPAPAVLGMEVPAAIAAKHQALLAQQKAEEDDDDDIFAGVGAEYNPLADIGSDEDDSDGEVNPTEPVPVASREAPEQHDQPRNYFGTTAVDDETNASHPLATDPTILAALKRAAALRPAEPADADGNAPDEDEEDLDPDKALRRKAFLARLQQQQRDDAGDLDMGFGASRFGDDEDDEGPVWDGEETKEKRKRAPKKRKGDKDNVQDVMGVLAGRPSKT